jgi:[ribosomal protein S5]-alanine N-acetyltransferase
MLTVQTERLQLVACPAQVARAAYQSRRQAETLLGVRVHDEWPGDDVRGFLPLYAQQVEGDASVLGWGIWVIVHKAEQVVIGDAGFKGKPDANRTVDIGYGIIPSYRRQGYGYEAALGLRDWAFTQPEVERMTADCLPQNTASARILEKLGMRQIGTSDMGMLMWEYRP